MLSTISPSVTALAVGPPAQRAIAQRFSALALICDIEDLGPAIPIVFSLACHSKQGEQRIRSLESRRPDAPFRVGHTT